MDQLNMDQHEFSKLLETGNEECIKKVTLDPGHDYRVQRRATIQTDTWDDELNAYS